VDKNESLDVIDAMVDLVKSLEATTDKDVIGTILVDAIHEFKSLHPMEKEVAFVFMLGQLVEANNKK